MLRIVGVKNLGDRIWGFVVEFVCLVVRLVVTSLWVCVVAGLSIWPIICIKGESSVEINKIFFWCLVELRI